MARKINREKEETSAAPAVQPTETPAAPEAKLAEQPVGEFTETVGRVTIVPQTSTIFASVMNTGVLSVLVVEGDKLVVNDGVRNEVLAVASGKTITVTITQ